MFIFNQDPNPLCICYNLWHEDSYLARFIVHAQHACVTPGEIALFRHISDYVQQMYLKHIGLSERFGPNDFLHKLCKRLLFEHDSTVSVAEMEKCLQSLHWEMNDAYQIYYIRYTSPVKNYSVASVLVRELESSLKNSCAIATEDQIVWLVNLSKSDLQQKPDACHKDFIILIREFLCKAGISNVFHNFYYMCNYYQQAQLALELGLKKDPHFWTYLFKDYLMDYVTSQLTISFTPEQLAHPGIILLLQHDMEHETAYLETIKKYIETRFNASRAAEELFVHRTTFLKRLERIEEISGINFSDRREILHVLLSLQLLNQLK